MNKKVIVGLILAIVFVGAGYIVIESNNNSKKITKSDRTSQAGQVENVAKTDEISIGQYLNYDASKVSTIKGRRVLFFYAPWCSQCNELERSIKAGAIPTDVTIFKTDFDTNQKLRQQYGVTLQTTLVLLGDDGSLLKKYVSYEEPNLESVIKNLL